MIKRELHRAFGVAALNPRRMQSLSKDRRSTRWAYLFIVLAVVAGALGSVVFPLEYEEVIYRPTIIEALQNAVAGFFLILGALYLVHLLANGLFKGQGTFSAFLRVAGYGYVVGLLFFFPILGLVLAVWILIIWEKSLVELKHLSHEQSILTLLFLIAFFMLLFGLVQNLDPANLYGGLYLTP